MKARDMTHEECLEELKQFILNQDHVYGHEYVQELIRMLKKVTQ